MSDETAVDKDATNYLVETLREIADKVERRGIHSLRGSISAGTMDITNMIVPEPAYVCECYDGNIKVRFEFRYADWLEFVNKKVEEMSHE